MAEILSCAIPGCCAFAHPQSGRQRPCCHSPTLVIQPASAARWCPEVHAYEFPFPFAFIVVSITLPTPKIFVRTGILPACPGYLILLRRSFQTNHKTVFLNESRGYGIIIVVVLLSH